MSKHILCLNINDRQQSGATAIQGKDGHMCSSPVWMRRQKQFLIYLCAGICICSCYRIALSGTFMPGNAISINITCTEAKLYLEGGCQLTAVGAAASLQQWWIQRQKFRSISRRIAVTPGAQTLPGASLRPLLPSSSCFGSSHPLSFCAFYSPEQTRSRSRSTTVSSGASTWGRSIQQSVNTVLSFLRQGDGVMASCTNAMALLWLLGENRGLKEGFCFSVPFLLLHHVTKMKCDTAMSLFPAYNLDVDF